MSVKTLLKNYSIDKSKVLHNILFMPKYQLDNVTAYHDGYILCNSSRGKKDIYVFKYFGSQYVVGTNKRSLDYSFDDKGWYPIISKPFKKTRLVLTGKARKLQLCKKSILAGVF